MGKPAHAHPTIPTATSMQEKKKKNMYTSLICILTSAKICTAAAAARGWSGSGSRRPHEPPAPPARTRRRAPARNECPVAASRKACVQMSAALLASPRRVVFVARNVA